MSKKVAPSPRKKGTLSQSELVLASALKRRKTMPVIVDPDVARGDEATIGPREFHRIDLDDRYQRLRMGGEVNDIIIALKGGGAIAEPIHLARRLFVEEGRPASDKDKLWIVDGQQRWWACAETETAFRAIVHKVHSLDEEKALFLVLNSRVQVNSNTIVHSWAGPIAELLRSANETEGHPLRGRVQFTRMGEKKIGAGIIVVGLCQLLSGTGHSRSIKSTLQICDSNLPGRRDQAATYLRLVGDVFPSGYAPTLAVQALAQVARQQWDGHVVKPPRPSAMASLSKVDWKKELPSYARRYMVLAVDIVQKRWKS